MEKRKARKCTYAANAEIIGMRLARVLRSGRRVENTYYVVWKYVINGAEHVPKRSMELKERGRKVGSVERIYVNPDNLDDIYIPGEADKTVCRIMAVMGVVFLLASVQFWLDAFGIT